MVVGRRAGGADVLDLKRLGGGQAREERTATGALADMVVVKMFQLISVGVVGLISVLWHFGGRRKTRPARARWNLTVG